MWPYFLKEEPPPKKYRLIYNLKHYNGALGKRRFRMETLGLLRHVARRGYYACSLDIKDMFHHVPLAPQQSRQFGMGPFKAPLLRYVVWKGMPFGLKHAPFWARQMLRPLVRLWRKRGLKVIVYVDDILVVARTATLAERHRNQIEEDLQKAGWTPHPRKGQRTATQNIRFLGFDVDLRGGRIRTPQNKVDKVKALAEKTLQHRHTSGERWASLLGSLHACAPATQQLAAILRPASHMIPYCTKRAKVYPTARARQVIAQALTRIGDGRGRPIWTSGPTRIVEYDMASSVGWAGGIRGTGIRAKGDWTRKEGSLKDKGRLELTGARNTCMALMAELRNKNVRLVGDNPKAQKYLRDGGGRDPVCTQIVLEVYEWANKNGISLLPTETRRLYTGRDLSFADDWSRTKDRTSWTTTRAARNRMRETFGRPELDLFADADNAAADTWFTRYNQPGTAGTDALAQSWPTDKLLLAVPPFSLIPRVLEHAESEHARVLLVHPVWHAAPWWPHLLDAERAHLPLEHDDFAPSRTAMPEPWITKARMQATLLDYR